MNIWESFTVEEKHCYLHQIGPLKVWIEYKNREWLIASERIPNNKEVLNTEVLTVAPANVTWCRFVLPEKERKVTLLPISPNRSVVVKPESALKIESGAHALFYVLLPIWVQISVGSEQKHLLTDLPTKVLSNTWFGEPHEGELCYYLKTWTRRTLDDLTPRPHQVVCP